MTEYAVLQALHEGRSLVVELSTSREGRRAWLGVYPLRLDSPDVKALLRRYGYFDLHTDEPVYNIRTFEIDRSLNEADIWLSEDDLLEKRDALAIGDQDLRAKLEQFGTRLQDLVRPFKSDYPI